MKSILKLIGMLISIILPSRISHAILHRCKKTRNIMMSTPVLRIFWNVVLFIPVLACDLVVAVVKTVVSWILPQNLYGSIRFIIKQMKRDVTELGFSFPMSCKRAKLLWALFTEGSEKHVSYGDKNPNITFYVIRPYFFLEPNAYIFQNIPNLLTQYYYNLQKLSYAVEKGYTPVVDWQNYGRMPHSEDEPVHGTTNAWEYYWDQPSKYTLEEVYQSKNVILSTQNIGQFGYIPNCSMSPPFAQYAKKLAEQCPKYASMFSFNKETQAYIDNAYDHLLKGKERVLGVIVRGSSYGMTGTVYKSHPKQLSINELIKCVYKYLQEWDLEYIFFTNETQELIDIMKQEFKEKLVYLPRLRDSVDRLKNSDAKNPMYAPGQKYQTNLDYITEIALLARCNSLLGSMSSGMRTAIILNAGAYENMMVVDKGTW